MISGSRLYSYAAEKPVRFQGTITTLGKDVVASSLRKIVRQDVWSAIKTGLR